MHLYDYLGNVRAVVNEYGVVEEQNNYYPYGLLFADKANTTGISTLVQPYTTTGKELDTHYGLHWLDYGARQYMPDLLQWTSVDPLCEKYYHLSPYAYCANNPVNAIDPDGESTWVINIGNGQYRIIGGNLDDNDFNIYVYSQDKNGNYTNRGNAIGQTPLMTSFYNSDAGEWAKGNIININDMSGINFFESTKDTKISLSDYIYNARNFHRYDFKSTNGTDKVLFSSNEYYRGMPFEMPNGKRYYSSARDIGNMMAGYKAGAAGIGWKSAEYAFDAYQSRSLKLKEKEGL